MHPASGLTVRLRQNLAADAHGRFRARRWVGRRTLLLLSGVAAFLIFQATPFASQIPDIAVSDDNGIPSLLREKLQQSRTPIIVLPIYTKCKSSCPLLVHKLEREAGGLSLAIRYRVLLFSFDDSDNPQSLGAFREREHIPREWVIVSARGTEARMLTAFFNYTIMTDGPVLAHPNELFLLDLNLDWRTTFVGFDWTANDLAKWISALESPTAENWPMRNRVKIGWAGVVGFLGGFALLVFWFAKKKPRMPVAALLMEKSAVRPPR